jgi:N-acetylglutamate synthase-like GNAT family acetyltransferase
VKTFTIANKPNDFEISFHSSEHPKLPQQDIQRIYEIGVECFAPGMHLDVEKTEEAFNSSKTFIMRHRGVIVGMISYAVTKDHIYIGSITVSKQYQHLGVGTALMLKVANVAKRNHTILRLCAPPRNQTYYSRFGFKVHRSTHDYWLVHGKDEKSRPQSYPIKILEMRLGIFADKSKNNLSMPLLFNQKRTIADSDITTSANGRACIDAVIQLARFSKQKTSFWYSLPFRSTEKEYAFNAIEQELMIHLSDIKQKTILTMKTLASIIVAIIKNAMIVRGYAFFSNHTTSGKALVDLLSGAKQNNLISTQQLNIINSLLREHQHLEIHANSYEETRHHVFKNESFYSTSGISPYSYYR